MTKTDEYLCIMEKCILLTYTVKLLFWNWGSTVLIVKKRGTNRNRKKKTEQAVITFSSLKWKEVMKYKSIYHSHFEGQTDWFSNAYLLFG